MEELRIKRSDLERVVLVGGRGKQTAQQVLDGLVEKPDFLLNGLMYDMATGLTVADTIVDGVLINGGNYTDQGIGVNDHDFISCTTAGARDLGYKSFLGGSPNLVVDGRVSIDGRGLGEWFVERGESIRLAMGFNDEELIFAFPEGKMTVVHLAELMREAGCRSAINLDGGGSTTVARVENGGLRFLNKRTENRGNSTWVLVYLKNRGEREMKIMLDPGHGGSDPGAVGQSGLREKDVVLKLAKRVGDHLSRQGVLVSYTRMEDRKLDERGNDLSARAAKANSEGVDYFVSLHCNSNAGTPAQGIETFIVGKGGEAEKIAVSVQNALVAETGRKSRGVKVGNLAVLRETRMPAILVELCFINNVEEEALLGADSFLEKSARAIAKGLLGYAGMEWRPLAENGASAWAREAQEWVIQRGVSDGTRPGDQVTREEVWQMLMQMGK